MKTAQNKTLQKRLALSKSKGFTLIELLVVIGILAVLLAITLIAINPQRQFSQANNTKRSSDINAILNAIGQYAADNKGALPTNLATTCDSAAPCSITSDTAVTSRADICSDLVPQYLAALPVDPLTSGGTPVTDCAVTYTTNYEVYRGTDNRITVTAPATELGIAILTVTR